MKSSIKKLLEKLKNVNWKSKKSIIAYAIILAVLGTGTGLAINYFNNSSDIVKTDVDIKDKNTSKPADDKKEDEKSDDKKDTDKKDENSKPTDKTDDKKQETSKTDDKKTNSSTNKTPVNNNNSNSNNNTSNNSSNNGNNTTTPPPTNNNSGSTGNSGGNTTPQPPAHTHDWQPNVEHIKHEEVWHWENQPIYGNGRWAEICKICGEDVTADPSSHNEEHMLAGETGPNGEGGWKTEWVQDIIGYEPVKVVDQEEWTETIDKGYKCYCGATK